MVTPSDTSDALVLESQLIQAILSGDKLPALIDLERILYHHMNVSCTMLPEPGSHIIPS